MLLKVRNWLWNRSPDHAIISCSYMSLKLFERHFLPHQKNYQKQWGPFLNAVFYALSESVLIFVLACLKVEKVHHTLPNKGAYDLLTCLYS